MKAPRQCDFEAALRRWNIVPGRYHIMMISREPAQWGNTLYMAGRLLPRMHFATPRDIDPNGKSALRDILNSRRIIMSRGAFHDLKAKYKLKGGWIWNTKEKIYSE